MVPRQTVVMLPRHAPPEEIRRILLEETHSRLPVYEGQVDNVVGYISVKDLLALAWQQELIVLEDVMRPPYFVPETKRAVEVLEEMRAKRMPFAIVVDGQGGMAGIITMEDLLEELVGEIFSEHARQVPELIKREDRDSAIVDGMTPIREINRELGLELPENGEWSTVAGLCLALAEKIPSVGETLTLPDGLTLEIVDASPSRVKAVRLRTPSPESTTVDTSEPT
jgi:putative hemolysin